MKTNITQFEIETYIEPLLSVLDKDVYYLEYSLSQLNELRRLVIKQQVDELHELLKNIRNQTNNYQGNNKKRQDLREKIARFVNCKSEDITLTWLETNLGSEKKDQIAIRKRKLQSLADSLKKEYAGTQLLLADCARFNRILLNSIFKTGQSKDVTYNTAGISERQTENVFVNLKL